MIRSKQDLKYYLYKDGERFDKKPSLKDYFLSNESWYLYRFVKTLRYVEYYKNSNQYLLNKLLFYWYFYWYKKLVFNLKIDIKPNTIGPGLRIYHAGGIIRIKPNCKIGKNFTIQPGVVIGNKTIENLDEEVVIGDNCYIGLDAKILGKITIGNNVTIGANSVVLENFPDNCIIGGIPAKILKMSNK